MREHDEPDPQRVARIESEVTEAFAAIEAFLTAVADERKLATRLRARAAEASRAVGRARRDWAGVMEDWPQIRDQVACLAPPLYRLERCAGRLALRLEEERW